MPRPPRSLNDPEHPRRRLLLTAADEFAEKGYERAMLEDIARKAGLSKAAVYRYFPSKQALVAAVASDEIDRAVATLDDIEGRNLPPAETLAALVETHVERLMNNLSSGRVALRQLPADIPELEHFHRQRLRYWRACHSIIRRGIAEGDFVPVPAWLAVEAIIGMASSVIDRFSPKWPLDAKTMAKYYAYLAVHSMLTPQALARGVAAPVDEPGGLQELVPQPLDGLKPAV